MHRDVPVPGGLGDRDVEGDDVAHSGVARGALDPARLAPGADPALEEQLFPNFASLQDLAAALARHGAEQREAPWRTVPSPGFGLCESVCTKPLQLISSKMLGQR